MTVCDYCQGITSEREPEPLMSGHEADLWRLYEELYGHRTDSRGPGVAVGGAIEVIRAFRKAQRSEKREPLTAQEWYEQFGPGKQAAPSATNAPDCPGCRMGLDLVEGLAHADANGYIVMGCERKR